VIILSVAQTIAVVLLTRSCIRLPFLDVFGQVFVVQINHLVAVVGVVVVVGFVTAACGSPYMFFANVGLQ